MKEAQKLGILGGTFNPVHNGHLFLALEAMHIARLDKVVFVPNRLPPHKEQPAVTAEKRFEMLLEATRDIPQFGVSRVELERVGPSYTYDTVHTFAPEQELTFICGADAFAADWYRLEGVIQRLSLLLVANRVGSLFEIPDQLKRLPQVLQKKVQLMVFPDIAISSSDIRSRIAQARPFRFLIPEPVYRIITESGLYGESSPLVNKNDPGSMY